MDLGVTLRCLFAWSAWVATGLVLAAWAVSRMVAVARGDEGSVSDFAVIGIVLLTIACTLNILNDNARTRRIVRVAVREGTEPGHLSSIV